MQTDPDKNGYYVITVRYRGRCKNSTLLDIELRRNGWIKIIGIQKTFLKKISDDDVSSEHENAVRVTNMFTGEALGSDCSVLLTKVMYKNDLDGFFDDLDEMFR